jgi:ABC-2 type transport system ATP-binding protein
MVCGLTPPTSGTASVVGVPYQHLPNPGRRVGVLLDAAAQHAGRTGREVLAVSARLMDLPRSRTDEVLDVVGLLGSAPRKRVRNYSLGMRQRLGLAHALLGDPEVLILDEPANGLDPEGIRWMRGLLRGHADRGGTVLLSSHLLHEIEVTADRLVMITGGRIVAQGTQQELLAGRGGVLVRTPDPARLTQALHHAGIAVRPTSDGALLAEADAAQVGTVAAQAGAPLLELRDAAGTRLEDLFFSLTNPESPGASQ